MTEHASNYESFRDCLSTFVIRQLAPTPAKSARKKRPGKLKSRRRKLSNDDDTTTQGNADNTTQDEAPAADADDLAEFTEYLAGEMFGALPTDLRQLTYSDVRKDEVLAARYSTPLPQSTMEELTPRMPASALDSLEAYGLVPSTEPGDVQRALLQPLMTAYSSAVSAPPANLGPGAGPRASSCELCGRDWVPLTYHHLIPRGVAGKAVKRGWHEEWRLGSVAWLCRACHSHVHRVASNEELARELYSVELLMEREEVMAFARWVGGVRWKKR